MSTTTNVQQQIAPLPVSSTYPVEQRKTPVVTLLVASLLAPVMLCLGVVAAPFTGGASLGVAALFCLGLWDAWHS